MSDLFNTEVPVDLDLDAVLDRLSPAAPLDDAAVARAFERLTSEMLADRSSSEHLRRRIVASLAVAAVGAGALIAFDVSSSHSDPGNASASSTLTQLAAFVRSQPSAAAGQYVRIVERSTRMTPAHNTYVITESGPVTGPTGHSPDVVTTSEVPGGYVPAQTQTSVDVTYRPVDLTSSAPWILQHTGDGTSDPAVFAKCDGFNVTSVSQNPCQPGSWDDPTPAFLATFAAESPDAAAAQVVSYLQHSVHGVDISPAALDLAWSYLQIGAGDTALEANVFDALAAVARHDSSLVAARTAAGYTISAGDLAHPDASGAESMTFDPATGTVYESGSRPSDTGDSETLPDGTIAVQAGSVGFTEHTTITASIISGALPAATPYRPAPDGGDSSGAPQPSPSH